MGVEGDVEVDGYVDVDAHVQVDVHVQARRLARGCAEAADTWRGGPDGVELGCRGRDSNPHAVSSQRF